ncbi:amidohydrolase family protein [Eubacteriales bacterium OttesenSCG-928-N14]|nr:amidohydrolase family protein [Eubacteriales bacterium OttesenSCG-928-N14]
MRIDFHTHTFSPKIVKRALSSLSQRSGNLLPQTDGTINGLLYSMDENNIDMAVVLNIATKPHQQRVVNDYAIEIMQYERIVAFGSVHPYAEDCLEELDYIKNAGMKGIKLHPDYQNFFVDDERAFRVYEKCGELGLITVFHAGVDIGYPLPVHCTPDRLAKVLPYFGGAPVVAAHFGGNLLVEEVLNELAGLDVYFDTSYCYANKPPKLARKIIDKHGVDKLLFGSDSPWSSQGNELLWLDSLQLNEADMQAILGGNAAKLLGVG